MSWIRLKLYKMKPQTYSKALTALWAAIQAGNEYKVECLTQRGFRSTELDRALMFAIQLGHDRVVDVLLHAGADVNNTDSIGRPALVCACQKGHKRVIEVLITCGASVNKITPGGWTALMEASAAGHDHVIDVLEQRWTLHHMLIRQNFGTYH